MRRLFATSQRLARHSRYAFACLAAAFPFTTFAATWINNAGGNFNAGANWSTNPNPPGPGDAVLFNRAATYTVIFDANPINGSVAIQTGNVTWIADNLARLYTVSAISMTGGNLTLNTPSGNLTVNSTALTVDGTGSPLLTLLGNSTLTTGNILIGRSGIAGASGTIISNATLTQTGASTLNIGTAINTTGNLTINAGTFTTGTGITTLHTLGKINLTGGTFNQNGDILVTGGTLNQTGGTFNWAGNHTLTINSAGNVTLPGTYITPTNANITITAAGSQFNVIGVGADLQINSGGNLSVTSAATIHSDEFFDIASSGNGVVTIDGTNSSLTTNAAADAGENFLGTVGTGCLTFSSSATGTLLNGFTIGSSAGSSGTLNVQSNATLTTGSLDVGDQTASDTGVINVAGGTLTETGNSALTLGTGSLSTATLNIGALATGGTFTTSTGPTTINTTGTVNLISGTFQVNGDLTVAGGSLNQTGGTFTWANTHTMTINSGGNVTLAAPFFAPFDSTINVTGNGSQFNSTGSNATIDIDFGSSLSVTIGATAHSDQSLLIADTDAAGVTVDGTGSSLSASGGLMNHLGVGGAGTLTFSTNATGSLPAGLVIGKTDGSSGTLNVQSNAVLTIGSISLANSGLNTTGIINLTGGTLTQTGTATLTVGDPSAGTATVNIGNATTSGTLTTGTGLTTINPTGKINFTAGTLNANGDITVTGGNLTQTGGSFNWAGNHTMLIQSAGNVTLPGGFSTPTNANITLTGAGSQFNVTGGSADLSISNGGNLSVTTGATVHSDDFFDIAGSGNGTVTIDGTNSSLTTNASLEDSENSLGTNGTGSLTFSSSATGSILNGFRIGNLAASSGTLNVQSNAILTTGSLDVAPRSAVSTGVINVAGGTLTQTPFSTLSVGAAASSTATINIGAVASTGTFTTGTGLTTINATGKINLISGTLNLNGNITLNGGSLIQTGGTFNWAPSQFMTINSGGNVTLTGNYAFPQSTITISDPGSALNNAGPAGSTDFRIINSTLVSVTAGGAIHSDQVLNIGDGTVTIDGLGSSFSSGSPNIENVIGNNGGSGSLTFSGNATGSEPGGIFLALNPASTGTLNVQSNAALTTGPLEVADQTFHSTGIINVTGGTLTQTGVATLVVGASSASSGNITIGNGGTFTTGTGLTTINATGKINLTAGTLNANGNITLTGGSLIQTGGSFKWAGNHTMLIQSGGNVTLLAGYTTPTNANITVTGAGSLLTDLGTLADLKIFNGCNLSVTSGASVHSDVFFDIAAGSGNGAGTVTIDGNNSSLTTNATSSNVQNFLGTAGTGSLTFSSSATGSILNGFAIGHAAGTSGTLNVQSNATLTTGSLNVGDQATSNTGTINVAGGTLIQTGSSTLLIGAASLSTATVAIGSGGTFTSGTGTTTINATGTFNLQPTGTANFNGNVTNQGGNLTLSGNQNWATTTTFANSSGSTTFNSNAKLSAISITGGTVDLTTAKIIIEATSNKSTTLTALHTDVANHTLITSSLPAGKVVAIVDNAVRLATFPGANIFGNFTNVDSNAILITAAFPGDANLDGVVDIKDLQDLANHWQQPATDWSQADFDNNGVVALQDLQALANHWQAGVGSGSGGGSGQSFSEALSQLPQFTSTTSTPEPASLFLLTPLLLLTRRRAR